MDSISTWTTFLYLVFGFISRFLFQVVNNRSFNKAVDFMTAGCEHTHEIKTMTTLVRPESFQVVDMKDRPTAVTVLYPETRDELIDAVKTSVSFRAIGGGCSFNDCLRLDTADGRLISLMKMKKMVYIDFEKKYVRVQAGMIVHDLILELEKVGLALRNMGNYDKQSIGGAIAGGTHGTCGSGNDDTFTSSILSVQMVTADGADVQLGPEDSVTYGLGGIIYEVQLQLTDFYYMRQKTTILNSVEDIHVEKWWSGDAAMYTMVRWPIAGTSYGFIQQVEYNQAHRGEYIQDKWVAVFHRLAYCLQNALVTSLPMLVRRIISRTSTDSCFVDKYYRQYVAIPAPHHCEFEYAVPFVGDGDNIKEILRKIPGTLTHVDFLHEVHIRIGPDFGDTANGHILKHVKKAVWLDLNVVVPLGTKQADINSAAKRFEELMARNGGVSHPNKATVDWQSVALAESTLAHLQEFQALHDHTGKMNTKAMKQILQRRKSINVGSTRSNAHVHTSSFRQNQSNNS